MAIKKHADGEYMVYIISDNNMKKSEDSLMMQFHLKLNQLVPGYDPAFSFPLGVGIDDMVNLYNESNLNDAYLPIASYHISDEL